LRASRKALDFWPRIAVSNILDGVELPSRNAARNEAVGILTDLAADLSLQEDQRVCAERADDIYIRSLEGDRDVHRIVRIRLDRSILRRPTTGPPEWLVRLTSIGRGNPCPQISVHSGRGRPTRMDIGSEGSVMASDVNRPASSLIMLTGTKGNESSDSDHLLCEKMLMLRLIEHSRAIAFQSRGTLHSL
jgi:hypothetical protein